MYCKKCKHIVESTDLCSNCKSRALSEPEENSPCFLVEKSSLWAGMLEDVLTQENIAYYTKGRLGAALAMSVGRALESYSFYVPYQQLNAAQSIVYELFGAGGEQAEI